MNKVILLGRPTKDIEVKYSANQTAVTRFFLAVQRPTKDSEADFISCVAFGKTAELLGTYIKKGQPVVIEGNIQTGTYENKDGDTVRTTDVIAQRVEFVPSVKKAETDVVPEILADTFETIDEEVPF